MMKNVTGVYGLSHLRFKHVLNADFFFTNLVLNYLGKSYTHFINTPSFSSQSHLMFTKYFFCKALGRHCNGFVYHCDKCYFDLDVQCSLRSDIMNHEGHEHQLILLSTSNNEKCNSCNRVGIIFCCAYCEFTLDFRCATLPTIIRYRSYEQSFTLCYKSEKDYDHEYYCDICEKPRNPKHWFYYCADLDFPAHPECILGEDPNIKFGKTYTFDIHEHPLALVDKRKGVHPLCNKCGKSSDGWTFECAKCNFNLHPLC